MQGILNKLKQINSYKKNKLKQIKRLEQIKVITKASTNKMGVF